MGFGAVIFNIIGACVRWTYGTIWRTITKQKKNTFREYLHGPDNSGDWFDMKGHELINTVIGLIFIVLICWIIIKLGI
ncbi:MAG: hypothetical protein JXJ22_01400 [Bacteroidales bacterium]|nr:hypothetical protein [Bacteroidales bacterium]